MAFTRFTQSSLTTGVGKYIDADAGRTPIPSVPTIGTATDGGTGTTVSVAFTPGYYPGNYYTVLSNPGSITATGNSSPITVSGLTTGTSYNFSVSATNNTGTSAYSAQSNFVTPVFPSSYESIASGTASGATEFTFSSIPSTYKHLQIRAIVSANSGSTTMRMRFNGDTGNNYTDHYLRANGTTVTSSYDVPSSQIGYMTYTNSGFSQLYLGVTIIDIIDYNSTSKYKTVKSFNGIDLNGGDVGNVILSSGLWLNTSAINSITLKLNTEAFSSNTQFALYGIKG